MIGCAGAAREPSCRWNWMSMYRKAEKCAQMVVNKTSSLGGGEWHEQNGIDQRGR